MQSPPALSANPIQKKRRQIARKKSLGNCKASMLTPEIKKKQAIITLRGMAE